MLLLNNPVNKENWPLQKAQKHPPWCKDRLPATQSMLTGLGERKLPTYLSKSHVNYPNFIFNCLNHLMKELLPMAGKPGQGRVLDFRWGVKHLLSISYLPLTYQGKGNKQRLCWWESQWSGIHLSNAGTHTCWEEEGLLDLCWPAKSHLESSLHPCILSSSSGPHLFCNNCAKYSHLRNHIILSPRWESRTHLPMTW